MVSRDPIRPYYALQLILSARERELGWMRLLKEYSQKHLTLISAIMVGVFTGLTQLPKFDRDYQVAMTFGLFLGPILNLFICYIGVCVSERLYERFLEEIIVMAKLEPIIGYTAKRIKDGTGEFDNIWPDDEYYLPHRWVKSRRTDGIYDSFQFTEEGKKKGAYASTKKLFIALAILNCILLAVLGFTAYLAVHYRITGIMS